MLSLKKNNCVDSLKSVFNNVMQQESNKGNIWNGYLNYENINPVTASFSDINKEKNEISLIDMLARFIMHERAISSGNCASEGNGMQLHIRLILIMIIMRSQILIH